VTVATRNEAIAAAHTIGMVARRERAASAARKRSFSKSPRPTGRAAGTSTRPVNGGNSRDQHRKWSQPQDLNRSSIAELRLVWVDTWCLDVGVVESALSRTWTAMGASPDCRITVMAVRSEVPTVRSGDGEMQFLLPVGVDGHLCWNATRR
jgi:hypothetical protein